MSGGAPVLVIEDDPLLRLVQVALDPGTSPERITAFAHFLAHDLPDFAAWCDDVRGTAGLLYPAQVRLVASQAALRAALPGARAVVVESLQIGPDELAVADQLSVVQKYGTLTRNIDLAACAARRLPVQTLRRRANIACAEFTLAVMLALAKQLHRVDGRIADEQLIAAGFAPTSFDRRHTAGSNWGRVTGLELLYQSTLGVVGLGEIGRELAIRARAFGMQVRYFQRHALPEAEEHILGVEYLPLDALLASSRWISIQLPLTPETRGLVNRERLSRMQPGAMLVNTSRAEIVDRAALIDSLASRHLGGFALDALYEEPGSADDRLLGFDNVILTPHLAAQPRFNALGDTKELIVRLARALSGPGGLASNPETGRDQIQ